MPRFARDVSIPMRLDNNPMGYRPTRTRRSVLSPPKNLRTYSIQMKLEPSISVLPTTIVQMKPNHTHDRQMHDAKT